MKTEEQWNDAGWCFRNASVLHNVGMRTAGDIWKERGEKLIADLVGKNNGVGDMFEQLLAMSNPARDYKPSWYSKK